MMNKLHLQLHQSLVFVTPKALWVVLGLVTHNFLNTFHSLGIKTHPFVKNVIRMGWMRKKDNCMVVLWWSKGCLGVTDDVSCITVFQKSLEWSFTYKFNPYYAVWKTKRLWRFNFLFIIFGIKIWLHLVAKWVVSEWIKTLVRLYLLFSVIVSLLQDMDIFYDGLAFQIPSDMLSDACT